MGQLFQKIEAFDKTHQGKWGYVVHEGYRLHEDGARRSVTSYGQLGPEIQIPVPGTPGLEKWQQTFWELKLDELVTAFEKLKSHLQGQAGQLDEEEMEELRIIKAKVRCAQSKLHLLEKAAVGFTQDDITKARECWAQLRASLKVANTAASEFGTALQDGVSSHDLRKMERWLSECNLLAKKCTSAWNGFEPVEARAVIVQEQTQARQQEQMSELSQIEV